MKKLNKLSIIGYGAGDAATTWLSLPPRRSADAISSVLTILAVLVMSKYKMSDARHAEILSGITARRTKPTAAGGPADAANPLTSNSM